METTTTFVRRRATWFEGVVYSFGGGMISCTVRNLSEHGALLDVTSQIG
ncbi:MAG: hypothetical protein ABI150_01615 [Nitrobacter sp.]